MNREVKKAIEDGLDYTGISYCCYDKKGEEEAENKVAEIKKAYKVRFRKVRASNGWISYYASKEYYLVAFNNEEKLKNRIATVEERKQKAFEEYNRAIVEIMKQEEEDKKQLEEIKKIKR